jgi:hypothetical protein
MFQVHRRNDLTLSKQPVMTSPGAFQFRGELYATIVSVAQMSSFGTPAVLVKVEQLPRRALLSLAEVTLHSLAPHLQRTTRI